ncbi:phytanoyl-CoA dioxygenase family protein [Paenibacillus roseipurpureus]|uniref:Phytanoyl-CoA dioxygenase family protein n=1 Tax=Paenibacillus roseopurpureus TaxID=2918901 RepID=A0AA96RJ36_9BACL|nr:phytanoyl-CoA dioxygenase family protein [Paenibacillus sp. MBLB1832]WNR43460.1 phytanoyl-CoA dioxygenase family protein [Paenibacillus sp. MBLB1832]
MVFVVAAYYNEVEHERKFIAKGQAAMNEKQLKQFNEEGYFIIENLFSAQEMDELTAQIDHYVDEHNEKLKSAGQTKDGVSRANEIMFTPHLVKKNALFQQFCAHPNFVDLTTPILGGNVSLFWDQAVYKHPETAKDFPWHQDNGYGLVLSEEYVTCWLALEDATIENGCIWVMPRTHKDGIVEHQKTPIGWQCYFGDDPGIPVELKKGSMVVFSSLLFHRSGPNVSNSVRKGYILQYIPSGVKNIKTGATFKKMIIAKNGEAALDTSMLEGQDHNAAV